MALSPIRENYPISDSPITPFTSETKTNGTAISCNNLIKTCPQGRTQSLTNLVTPNDNAATPIKIPISIPINIFAYKGMEIDLFIYQDLLIEYSKSRRKIFFMQVYM